jgi:hypothetical protein
MKPATACTQCRASKRKCWQPKTGASCTQCHRNQLLCSIRTAGAAADLAVGSTVQDFQDEPAIGLPVSKEVAGALVEEYIRCIHDRPHSIFHLPSLRSAVRLGKLNLGTFCALLSYGARFHPDTRIAGLAATCFEEAKRHLHSDLENVSLENIQTAILLASLSAASMRPSSEALYLRIAIGMAEILRLNVPQNDEPFVAQELKRRIWWTLYMADRWCSAGSSLPRRMSDFDRTVDLPIDEAIFHQPVGAMQLEGERPTLGLWAHMITLAEIFGPIQDLNRQIAQQVMNEEAIQESVFRLKNALEVWEMNLPDQTKYSFENLCYYQERGQGGVFVSLHQGFNHYATLLLYQYLDVSRATNATAISLAKLCKEYAKRQSALYRVAKDLGDCEVLFPGAGHSAAISSSVLLHTLLFGHENELNDTRSSLQSNLEILSELRRYWPSIELIVRRLTVFQKACLLQARPQSYKFDNWMVKFLLEYHLPLDDRVFNEARELVLDDWNAEREYLQNRGDFGSRLLWDFWE